MTDFEKAIEDTKTDLLPFESWERLTGETSLAFAAFCVFRDLGVERNIRRAVETVEADEAVRLKRYKVWRNWAARFRWRERAEDYDRYTDKLKQMEKRKTIKAQGKKQREATGKMLDVVIKKLDTMNPAELPHGAVPVWTETAAKVEREAVGLVAGNNNSETTKQGEFDNIPDFQGL